MSIKALLATRAKLQSFASLNAYWQSRYQRPAKHIIGYKKPVNANDYPAICYVPINSTRPDSVGGMAKEIISLVVGINEPEITNDIFDGVSQLAIIEGLIFDCLEAGELGVNAMYLGEAKTTSDLSVRHPFHELEITFLAASR